MKWNDFVYRLVRLFWEFKGNYKIDEDKFIFLILIGKIRKGKKKIWKYFKFLYFKEFILCEINGEEFGI